MDDKTKSKQKLMDELIALRRRVAAFEKLQEGSDTNSHSKIEQGRIEKPPPAPPPEGDSFPLNANWHETIVEGISTQITGHKLTEMEFLLSKPKGQLILIVDDELINLQILSAILSKERYWIETAMNGRQALDIVGRVSPDLVLLDVVMPEMDGYEVCRILKESPKTKDIPVIFITVKDEMEDILKGFEAGAVDYVTRPFSSVELLARVRTHAELKKKKDTEKELIDRLTVALVERNRAEEELIRANDNLEHLVKERTAELTRSNEQLREEIEKRKFAEAQLHASLREKELLLREVHHRVKNNMQVISGLLDLQASLSGNQELREMYRSSQSRIRSMAMIHEKLYGSKDFARIDMAGYVITLSQDLFQSYKINPGEIDLIIQTDDDVYVDINKAIPCGLILNELISNALKHAFPGEGPGEIKIIIGKTKSTEIEIVARDNGLGLPEDVDIDQPRTVGLYLVNGLVKNQLDGQIEVRRDNGTEFRIKVPL